MGFKKLLYFNITLFCAFNSYAYDQCANSFNINSIDSCRKLSTWAKSSVLSICGYRARTSIPNDIVPLLSSPNFLVTAYRDGNLFITNRAGVKLVIIDIDLRIYQGEIICRVRNNRFIYTKYKMTYSKDDGTQNYSIDAWL